MDERKLIWELEKENFDLRNELNKLRRIDNAKTTAFQKELKAAHDEILAIKQQLSDLVDYKISEEVE